ncbi:protein FAM81A [Patella vulgata]|uniref:protein FAM81A n=1 Tax=Patella vulgata TaxID=6465 RepID=UPI002180783F|nr:protein FAM81A [Patella vulgata]XP_050402587.1 protein FAM81A [Patella vulgata]XP_050402588.1 protein FAM81A [Patella vulgata]
MSSSRSVRYDKPPAPTVYAPYETNQDFTAIAVGGSREQKRRSDGPLLIRHQEEPYVLRHYEEPSNNRQQEMAPIIIRQEQPTQLPPVIVQRDSGYDQTLPLIQADMNNHLDALEDRISQQEVNTQGLLQRTMKIKEDVIDSLNFTHGTWNDEKHARTLLQEHIRSITAVVNRLNHDISAIEDSLRLRDGATIGQNNALKNLEVHHVGALSDVRGRIVRCDTSIGRLGIEVKTCVQSIRTISHQQQELANRMSERMNGIETQIAAVVQHIERIAGESRVKIQHVEGDTSNYLTMLDAKTRHMIEDLQNSLTTMQAMTETERERMEDRIIALIEQYGGSSTDLERIERKIDDNYHFLDMRILKLEDRPIQENSTQIIDIQNNVEASVLKKMDARILMNTEDIARLKRECREGFVVIQESITNAKLVNDGKRKILEEQLRKEIGHLRKMVVLV